MNSAHRFSLVFSKSGDEAVDPNFWYTPGDPGTADSTGKNIRPRVPPSVLPGLKPENLFATKDKETNERHAALPLREKSAPPKPVVTPTPAVPLKPVAPPIKLNPKFEKSLLRNLSESAGMSPSTLPPSGSPTTPLPPPQPAPTPAPSGPPLADRLRSLSGAARDKGNQLLEKATPAIKQWGKDTATGAGIVSDTAKDLANKATPAIKQWGKDTATGAGIVSDTAKDLANKATPAIKQWGKDTATGAGIVGDSISRGAKNYVTTAGDRIRQGGREVAEGAKVVRDAAQPLVSGARKAWDASEDIIDPPAITNKLQELGKTSLRNAALPVAAAGVGAASTAKNVVNSMKEKFQILSRPEETNQHHAATPLPEGRTPKIKVKAPAAPAAVAGSTAGKPSLKIEPVRSQRTTLDTGSPDVAPKAPTFSGLTGKVPLSVESVPAQATTTDTGSADTGSPGTGGGGATPKPSFLSQWGVPLAVGGVGLAGLAAWLSRKKEEKRRRKKSSSYYFAPPFELMNSHQRFFALYPHLTKQAIPRGIPMKVGDTPYSRDLSSEDLGTRNSLDSYVAPEDLNSRAIPRHEEASMDGSGPIEPLGPPEPPVVIPPYSETPMNGARGPSSMEQLGPDAALGPGIKDKILDAVGEAKSTAGDWAHRAGDLAHRAGDFVGDNVGALGAGAAGGAGLAGLAYWIHKKNQEKKRRLKQSSAQDMPLLRAWAAQR